MSDPFKTAVAVLTAATVIPAGRVVDTNDVTQRPTMPYTVVSVSPAQTGTTRGDATYGTRVWRIVTQSFGRTLDGVLTFDQLLSDGLINKRPVVTGYQCTACELEVSGTPLRDPDDDGVIGLTNTYTFNTTKDVP